LLPPPSTTVPQLASGVITPTIRMPARPTDITGRSGFTAACSSASAPGTAGAGVTVGADTGIAAGTAIAADMAIVAVSRLAERTAAAIAADTLAEYGVVLHLEAVEYPEVADLVAAHLADSAVVDMPADSAVVDMPADSVAAATAAGDTGKTWSPQPAPDRCGVFQQSPFAQANGHSICGEL